MIMLLGLSLAAPLRAAPPDAKTLAGRMKRALEPDAPSLRKVTLTVSQEGTTSQVTLGQARAKVAGGPRILTVVLAPADLRGTAYLVKEEPAGPNDRLWIYLPAIGRVRTVVSPEAFSAFLNSDFTYADLGFVNLRARYSVVGEATVDGTHAYRLESVPSQQWYYSRIVTAVAADSALPVERKFYDPASQLWKVEKFHEVATIDGVPTVLDVEMDDVQAKSRSELVVTDLEYGGQVPDALLDPAGLPHAAASPVWTALNAPVRK
jgi:hypothetical protein